MKTDGKDLPREGVVHDITEADKASACCDNELNCIGEYICEKLHFILLNRADRLKVLYDRIKSIQLAQQLSTAHMCDASSMKPNFPKATRAAKTKLGEAILYTLNQNWLFSQTASLM